MARDRKTNSILASLDPDFAKIAAEDPFMTGDFVNPLVGVAATVRTVRARTPSIEKLADQYGLNIDDYKNKFPASLFSKYDDDKFADDVAEKQIDLDVSDAGGEAIPSTPSVARNVQTIEDTRRRRAEEQQEQARKEQEIIDQNFAESLAGFNRTTAGEAEAQALQRSQRLRGQANIAPEDFDVSAPKIKEVEQPVETKAPAVEVEKPTEKIGQSAIVTDPETGRLISQSELNKKPSTQQAFEAESPALVQSVKDRVRSPLQLEEKVLFAPYEQTPMGDFKRGKTISVSRAAAEELKDRDATVQRDFQRELARQDAEIQARRDRGEGGAGVGKGESPTGSDVAGTPFKKGGLASLKTKTKPKKKMKRGGLASKK